MTDETAPVEPSEGVEPAPIEDELTRLRRALDEAKQLLDEKTDRYLRAVAALARGAARAGSEAQSLLAGVELIQRELLKVLEKFGVTPYSAVGQPFDPERHEAVQRVIKPDAPDMTGVEEIQRGYVLNGRVLRPAMVVVAVPPDSETA